MTKKSLFSAAFAALMAAPAMAGGLLTNTNQNAAFLRNFSQNGTIGLTSIYANPAGGAFLSNGWHLSLSSQTAFQERKIATTFPYFAGNVNNPSKTHNFVGEAKAPVVPSFTLAYNQDKWGLSAHFAIGGGGGKCQFNEGLGSFESVFSSLLSQAGPAAMPLVQAGMVAAGVPETFANPQYAGYSLNQYMKGRSYYFGLQVGATYKWMDNLSTFIGVRGVYATCNYNGFANPSLAWTNEVPAQLAAQIPSQGVTPMVDFAIALNCDQTGFGVTPIIGVNWKVNKHWNLAAKFEAPTKINLENESEIGINPAIASQAAGVLGKFEDGAKVREDIPGILALGAQYSPIESVRLSAGFNEYFDKSAKKYGNKEDLIDHNTWELNAGAEYDALKWLTVSASWQTTQYGLSDEYMSDLDFNLSSHSVGFGFRFHATQRLNIDLGYMHTFYGDRTVKSLGGAKTDVYSRTNNVVGIGFNLSL